MSFSATLTIEASMIAMISPSITVSVIIASGGLALRSAFRSAAVIGAPGARGAAIVGLEDIPVGLPAAWGARPPSRAASASRAGHRTGRRTIRSRSDDHDDRDRVHLGPPRPPPGVHGLRRLPERAR